MWGVNEYWWILRLCSAGPGKEQREEEEEEEEEAIIDK